MNQPMTLTIVLKRDDQAAFDKYLKDIYDPHSKNFHHYLSQRQIADRFGPSQDHYESMLTLLTRQGFKLERRSINRLTITVRGTRATAERAFAIGINDYRMGRNSFYAADSDPALPAEFAARVQSIAGFSNFARPEVAIQQVKSDVAKCFNTPYLNGAIASLFNPQCWAKIFSGFRAIFSSNGSYTSSDPPAGSWPTLNGAGQTIALLEFDTYATSDVANYLSGIDRPAEQINNGREVAARVQNSMLGTLVRAAKAVNYVSAGTIEFLVDAERNFYFLEMNTRIQVEHPVTELVTGVDLVRTQIEIAAGAKLPFKQKDLAQRGWAIECRIYAEDPAAGFVPAPGKIETLRFPDGPGVRNDAGVYAGAEVPVFYDPMISKLAVWGANRGEAIDRMRRALGEFVISGELRTNLDFHRWIMTHPKFLKGDFDTNFINQEYHPNENGAAPRGAELAAIFLAAIAAQKNANHSNGAGAQPVSAPNASAWRMIGRLDALRR